MTNKVKALLILLSVLLLGLIACRNVEVKEESEPELKYVRILDVEEQNDPTLSYRQHYALAGILKFCDGTLGEPDIPFSNQMKRIEKETEIQIEYVVLKSWDELPAKLEEAQMEGITTIVLFNNSYDGSLIREANSGKYVDMEAALNELGFYDESAYKQTVLKSGMTEKGQVLVPILYNVSGMVQGDMKSYDYDEWREMATNHAEDAALDYGTFLERLQESMQTSNVEEMEVPFLSAAFLEDKVDMYLMASGIDLEQIQGQEELFSMLYDYLKCYDETQVKTKQDKVSNQKLYAQYIKNYEETPLRVGDKFTLLSEEIANQLKIENWSPDMHLSQLAITMLNQTDYFVECSSAENVAYHSVFGTLAYRNYYVDYNVQYNADNKCTRVGNMNYWPIGVLNSDTEYAAQPICYAAVIEGSNTRLAAEVIQSMMHQYRDVKYGISVCNQLKDEQLDKWKSEQKDENIGYVRIAFPSMSGVIESCELSYWGIIMTSRLTRFSEDREIYANQVAEQIDNIVVARIPDREVLAIWQDTLTEAVDSGLSAEAGFELLCDRMEKRSIEE